MEQVIIQWRIYKEEYERLSDWLQQIENSIKTYKTTLLSNVFEKEHQVIEVEVTVNFNFTSTSSFSSF